MIFLKGEEKKNMPKKKAGKRSI